MKNKTIRYELDKDKPLKLTEEQKAQLAKLATMPDSEIDLSEIPELTDDFWGNAVRGRFYKPTKQATTVRVDSDVLYWLKKQGKGYQTRMNTILREAMLDELKRKHG